MFYRRRGAAQPPNRLRRFGHPKSIRSRWLVLCASDIMRAMAALSNLMVAPRMIDGVAAARDLFTAIAAATDEVAAIAYLASDRRLLGMRHVRGTRDWVAVSPRILATDALTLDARGVIMAHNHPSGDPTPSARDLAYMRSLARMLEALDIRLIDSLVLAGDETTSLRSLGLL